MNWFADNWVLIVLGIVVVAVALWWLAGSGRQVEGDKPAPGLDRRADEVSPVVAGPAATPIDVPPPSQAEPVMPEPEALVEPIHAIPAGPPDELTTMKGVGPKVAALLNGLGVTRYDQIAAWSDADVARVDAQLGAFKGRVTRDQWVEQARLLAAGDKTDYEANFGKLG